MGEVKIPLCTTNRINRPETAERVIATGQADMVCDAVRVLTDCRIIATKLSYGLLFYVNFCVKS